MNNKLLICKISGIAFPSNFGNSKKNKDHVHHMNFANLFRFLKVEPLYILIIC